MLHNEQFSRCTCLSFKSQVMLLTYYTLNIVTKTVINRICIQNITNWEECQEQHKDNQGHWHNKGSALSLAALKQH